MKSPIGSSAPVTMPRQSKRAQPPDYDRDLKLEALVPVVRGELPLLVFADRSREIRNAVEFSDKQRLR